MPMPQKENLNYETLLKMDTLPSKETVFSLAQGVCQVLASESSSYRPLNCIGEPGSLLELEDDLPVVLVPDIHARPDFVLNILNYHLPKKMCGTKEDGNKYTVLEALQNKQIYVICVGDGIHTELYASRWELISIEFEKGDCAGLYMKDEMILGLSTLCALMKLKIDFPQNFHFLKGNHENILDVTLGGDYSFCKYAREGEMVKLFMLKQYGDKVLNMIAKYENLLPLIAVVNNYVISHAEPAQAFTREQLIDARFDDSVVEGLIWTRNGQVKENTALAIAAELLGKKASKKSLYFAGHRPVKEEFALRQDGRFIQIHNPRKQNVFLLHNERKFDFSKDIVNVKPGKNLRAGGKEK